MAKFDIKTVKPKFVVTTNPDNKIEVVVNKPIITSKLSKSFFQLKNTGGPRGVKGEKGDPGQDSTIEVVSTTTGAPGTDASVVNQGTSSAARLAFTIPRGDKGSKGDKGDTGYSPSVVTERKSNYVQIDTINEHFTTTAKVYDGEDGEAATVTVGSTTTGDAGTEASVVNSGTTSAAVLDFVIPKGDKGDTGSTGAPGSDGFSPIAAVSKSGDTATITITDKNGTTTASVSDGVDGTDGFSPIAEITQGTGSATISITDKDGTTTATVYDGATGSPGQAATIAVDSTSTLPAGSSATVTNVGTSSAARLAFGIPKGETGAAGADGDAATIQIGQVETLQPNQSAYVTNVGTSSAAIFNIGIPQGEKGESGSGSGDMLAADYDPNSTVKNAGGIPNYVSSQLPTVNDATLTVTQNGVTAGTFSANASSAATIALTDTTYSDMAGATSSAAGTHGLVPAPAAGDQGKYLKGDGTWANTPTPELVEMAYGESNAWAKFIAAYNAHCIVYCRASSNANPGTGAKTRKAFMAYVNDENSPTTVEFQYYRSVSTHSDSQQGDQVFVYTLTNANGGTWSVTTRNTFSKIVAGSNMTSSYSSGTLTLNATQPTVPTKTSDLTNDSGFITSSDLPTKTSDLTNDGSDGSSTYVEADELATVATTGAYSDLSGTPTLATVATTGDYDDLTDKPTIPTVNDATLTIQKNGTTVQTFTANASTDVTADITVPTQLSDLSGTVSNSQIADGAVTSAKISTNTVSGLGSYSTTEIETPYTWIDGKTIYRKVVPVNGGSGTTISASLGSGFTVSSTVRLDFIFNYKETQYNSNQDYSTWNYKELVLNKNNNNLSCVLSQSLTYASGYFIVEYTKV